MNHDYAIDEGQLFDAHGQRKYLTSKEAALLREAARNADRRTRLFCDLLHYTGCRISEGLALTPRLMDVPAQLLVFRTLKRRKTVYRAVPIPKGFMRELVALARECGPDDRLFPWSRQTGWRRITRLMQRCGIEGPQATAKGYRHFFGVHAIGQKVPEATLKRWMGHSRSRNTEIYLFATGPEERALAARMW